MQPLQKQPQRLVYGFREAAEETSLSQRFLRNAADDPDPTRRLRTVRVARRRLIRASDLRIG
jgi:hypothetical protein